MRLAKHGARRQLDINMTPMIDVVFQLLIFFMTCSQVSEVNREPLELPQMRGQEEPAPSEFIVNVDADGVIHLSGIEREVHEIASQCDIEAKEHGGDITKVTVVLRVDRRAECKTVNELVTALVRKGLHRIRVAVATDS